MERIDVHQGFVRIYALKQSVANQAITPKVIYVGRLYQYVTKQMKNYGPVTMNAFSFSGIFTKE